MPKFLIILSALILLSCGGEAEEQEDVNIEESFDELNEEIIGPVWEQRGDDDLFLIDIPTQMEEMDQLNPEARLQYGFIDKVEGAVHENYVIVIAEVFPEADVADKVDILGFTEAYLDSLMNGRENYTVENEPAIESINGMNAVIHELKAPIRTANDSLIDIYYMLGVYAGQNALYQVLSWTLYDQKSLFRADMKHMIYSFNEIGTEGEAVEEEHDHDHDHDDHSGHNH